MLAIDTDSRVARDQGQLATRKGPPVSRSHIVRRAGARSGQPRVTAVPGALTS
jgi:hypothetical protein